jgi:flavodoxin
MEKLIVFDSNFGNTKKIAVCIADRLGSGATAVSVIDFKESDLSGIKLLVVGSPINAWGPTKRIKDFLTQLSPAAMKGIKAAAFDTRVKSFFSGNAAKKIEKVLQNSGASVISTPMGFYVGGNEGPLLDNELKRAEAWAESLSTALQST